MLDGDTISMGLNIICKAQIHKYEACIKCISSAGQELNPEEQCQGCETSLTSSYQLKQVLDCQINRLKLSKDQTSMTNHFYPSQCKGMFWESHQIQKNKYSNPQSATTKSFVTLTGALSALLFVLPQTELLKQVIEG